jgi:hypothetical protein
VITTGRVNLGCILLCLRMVSSYLRDSVYGRSYVSQREDKDSQDPVLMHIVPFLHDFLDYIEFD